MAPRTSPPTADLHEIPKDTPSLKMWPVANSMIAAAMGGAIIVAFHLLRLMVSIIPSVQGISALSWVLMPAICFASFFAGAFAAFALRNLEGRSFTPVQNAFVGAISGLIGSAVGIGITLFVDLSKNFSSMGGLFTDAAVTVMVGGFTSILSALFAALGAAAFAFIMKK